MAAGESLDKTGTSEGKASPSSPHRSNQASNRCPLCGSTKNWKDGLIPARDGSKVQRYICRECGYRFSPSTITEPRLESDYREPEKLTESEGEAYINLLSLDHTRRVCASEGVAKNLVAAETQDQKQAAGEISDVKALVFEYAWWMKKQGYSEATIEGQVKLLRIMVKRGGSLSDPDSIKEVIAKQEWSQGRKENAVDAYTGYLRMHEMTWAPPQYRKISKLPFIPTETEIDQLIAGSGKKTSSLLQLLKETGMRIGEAWKLQWTDLDFTANTIRVTPEKGSNPRIFKLSNKLIAMLGMLQPATHKRIFGRHIESQRRLYYKTRINTARKLQNPRLLQISFHTFRHWKATTEYARTKDILHVMRILGHKNINNTLKYTQFVDFGSDEYVSKVATTVPETCELVELGFEYVCDMGGAKIFRKRK